MKVESEVLKTNNDYIIMIKEREIMMAEIRRHADKIYYLVFEFALSQNN